jgi:hypothetical protein
VLTRSLFEKEIKRLAAAIKPIPVVRLCEQFDLMHAQWL